VSIVETIEIFCSCDVNHPSLVCVFSSLPRTKKILFSLATCDQHVCAFFYFKFFERHVNKRRVPVAFIYEKAKRQDEGRKPRKFPRYIYYM
jgi:hypothetical protein